MNGIKLDDVSVSYNGRRVVHDLSLHVPAGSWMCLIGPNGSGKTTVLRAISGLVPYSGGVSIGNDNAARLSRRNLARRVAVVPQNPVIPTGAVVIDYVLMGRTPYVPYLGTESRHDVEITAEVLDRLDLEALASRPLSSLSGGELQRAVLARALAQQAPIMLLDEPTTGLDIGHQQQVLGLVDRLRREQQLTVLSAMHDLTVAGQFAEELFLLREGRLAAAGNPSEVLTADVIGKHYGAEVRIIETPEGVVVVPTRPESEEVRAPSGTGARTRLP